MDTSEDMVLKAAKDGGWTTKHLRPAGYTPYRAYEFQRGGRKVIAQFDKVDAGMVDAFTSGRDFDGRQDLIEYLRGK